MSFDPAPADAAPHAPWPRWKKILAYAVFAALAVAATWFINRHVTPAPMPKPATTSAASPA